MGMVGDIITGVGNVLGNLTNAGSNLYGTIKTVKQNEKNFELQKENYNYQKDLQQTIFNREDNAVQRRVADLKAAGLSPTLAAGSSASAGSVVSTHAPQRQSDLEAYKALASVGTLLAQQQKAQTEADIARQELEQTKLDTNYYKSHGLAPVQASQSWQQYLVNLLAPKVDSQIALPVVDYMVPSFATAVGKAVESNKLHDVNNFDYEIVEDGGKVINKSTGAYLTTFQAGLLKQKGLYQKWVQNGFTPDIVKALRIKFSTGASSGGGGSSW